MVKITKTEMEHLKALGFKNKEDIHRTIASGKKITYFATESYEVMRALTDYRKSIGITD